jgi:hypothetical protein
MRSGARFICCISKRKILQHMFHGPAATEISPLNELCSALPSLPMRLQQVGRFVAANDYDATTRSMRDLAAEAGADPAAFTRLAKGAGLFRMGRAARRLDRGAPAGAIRRRSRAHQGRRRGPIPTSRWSPTSSKPKRQVLRASRRRDRRGGQGPARAQRIWIAGFRSCRSVAELLNYQLRLFRPDDGATGRRLRPRGSRSRRFPRRRCRSS